MILKQYTALGALDDNTDNTNYLDDSSWWDKATNLANSGAVNKILTLFGAKDSGGGSTYVPRPAASSTSPWLWVGGGVLGVVALGMLLRRR